jgi:hypothetical protein
MTASRPVGPCYPRRQPLYRPGKPGAGRPLPLASPPGRRAVVYGSGRIDASGRVADRSAIAALGWRGGDRLTPDRRRRGDAGTDALAQLREITSAGHFKILYPERTGVPHPRS